MPLNAWHERISTLEEERQFKKLIALHSLTHTWVELVSKPNEDSALRVERMPRLTLKQNLWLLEKARLDEVLTELDSLVNEQKVSEFLKELSETIWLIQISTLENAFSESKDPSLLMNLLKNAAWNHGKKAADAEWAKLDARDLGQAYHAFLESHMESVEGFLLGRAAETELNFYWVKSPLQNPNLSDLPQIETLCALHQEWIHGFFYGLSRKIQVKSEITAIDDRNWIHFTLLLTY